MAVDEDSEASGGGGGGARSRSLICTTGMAFALDTKAGERDMGLCGMDLSPRRTVFGCGEDRPETERDDRFESLVLLANADRGGGERLLLMIREAGPM